MAVVFGQNRPWIKGRSFILPFKKHIFGIEISFDELLWGDVDNVIDVSLYITWKHQYEYDNLIFRGEILPDQPMIHRGLNRSVAKRGKGFNAVDLSFLKG